MVNPVFSPHRLPIGGYNNGHFLQEFYLEHLNSAIDTNVFSTNVKMTESRNELLINLFPNKDNNKKLVDTRTASESRIQSP